MSSPAESRFERILASLILAATWAASGLLLTGLILWLIDRDGAGHALIVAGLWAFLGTPVLKLGAVSAAAAREGDRLTLAAAAAVMAILFALTLRDAASLL